MERREIESGLCIVLTIETGRIVVVVKVQVRTGEKAEVIDQHQHRRGIVGGASSTKDQSSFVTSP